MSTSKHAYRLKKLCRYYGSRHVKEVIEAAQIARTLHEGKLPDDPFLAMRTHIPYVYRKQFLWMLKQLIALPEPLFFHHFLVDFRLVNVDKAQVNWGVPHRDNVHSTISQTVDN